MQPKATHSSGKRPTARRPLRVATAFRRMARGVESKAAYASTVAFYRAGGQAWARQLG